MSLRMQMDGRGFMRFIILGFFSICLFVGTSFAEIKKEDLSKNVVLTEEAMLLSQVDTVSLYLTSDRAVFAPRLSNGIVEIDMTVLASDLVSDSAKMKDYSSRIINTFISVLSERLPDFAPMIAKTFSPEKDIVFTISAGADKTPAGSWKSGKLEMGSTDVKLPESQANNAIEPSPKKGKNCACPVRR